MKLLFTCAGVFHGADETVTVMMHPAAIQPHDNRGIVEPTGATGGAIALHMRSWLAAEFKVGANYAVEVTPA